jgi:thymidylate synthase
MVRDDALHMLTSMRSNDVSLGFPHDVFCFTMIQEIIAADLSVQVGTYKHAVGSLHLYEEKAAEARQFLEEGFQSTLNPMPQMPRANPWPSIHRLLRAEKDIRTKDPSIGGDLETLDPYWGDLVRLLQVYRYYKDKDPDSIEPIRGKMSSEVYRVFVDKKLSDSRAAKSTAASR